MSYDMERREFLEATAGTSLITVSGCLTPGVESENNQKENDLYDFEECDYEPNMESVHRELEEQLGELDSGDEMITNLRYESGYQEEVKKAFDDRENVEVVDHYDVFDKYKLKTDRCGISVLSNLEYVDIIIPEPEPELH